MAEPELDTLSVIDPVLEAPQLSVMALLNNLFLQIGRTAEEMYCKRLHNSGPMAEQQKRCIARGYITLALWQNAGSQFLTVTAM
jgi:hypothetical protein